LLEGCYDNTYHFISDQLVNAHDNRPVETATGVLPLDKNHHSHPFCADWNHE
jgi:hypothetical protein